MSDSKIIQGLGASILVILLCCAVAAISALPLMLAWNCVMPEVFRLPAIGFWQAFSLCVVFNTLVRTSTPSSKSEE